MTRPQTEMINKFSQAQKMKPSKGDFVEMLQSDKNTLKIQVSDKKISKTSKYKKMVKSAIMNEVFNDLIRKNKHIAKCCISITIS